MSTPYIGFTNRSLNQCPQVKKGSLVKCPHCGGTHALECGTSGGKECDFLMFFKCGETAYLGAVKGRLVTEARANDRWLDYCIDHDKHPDDDAGCPAWQGIFSEEGVV